MASDISPPMSGTASNTSITSTKEHPLHYHYHSQAHHQQIYQQHYYDHQEASSPEYHHPLHYHTPPQLSRPQSAHIHNYHGHRVSPQWPHDHRHNGHGYPVSSQHNNLSSNTSLKSHGRHHSDPSKVIVTNCRGNITGGPPSPLVVDLRLPSHATIRDSEKGHGSTSPVQQFSPVEPMRSSYSYMISHDLEAGNEKESNYTKQTLRALIHLAISNPFTSSGACIYTILVLLYVFLTIPFHLCTSDPSKAAGARAVHFLLRPLNAQRRCIFAPQITTATTPLKLRSEGSTSTMSHEPDFREPCKTSTLIFTHLLSPLVSLPLAFAAWCTAFAWLPSEMLSHERTAGVSDDERRMAERLVGMWLKWLDWCVIDLEEEARGRRRQRRAERASR